MDHADVLDRIADAAATPSGLERLASDRSPDAVAVNAHLETCPDCHAELVAWQRTSAALLDATPDTLRAPAEARSRILSAVVRDGIPRGAGASGGMAAVGAGAGASLAAGAASGTAGRPPITAIPVHHGDTVQPLTLVGSPSVRRPSPLRFRQLALAAAAVLIVFLAGALLGPRLGLTPKDHGVDNLVAAIAASNQILLQPGHREAVLTRSDGSAAGSVLVNPATGDIVVLSGQLDINTADYHCNLVRGGGPQMWIGPMLTQGGTAYWAGKVSSVADLGRPGDVIQVVDGGPAPELTATF